MTNQTENLEDVKKAWIAMGKSFGMQIPEYDHVSLDNKKTALERLRNSYMRFFIAAAIFTVTSLFVFSRFQDILDNNNVEYLGFAYSAYFFIAFLMDFWIWNGIGTINPLTMSVSEVTEKSLFYRKRHLQFVAVLLPLAVSLMCFTGYVFSADKYFLMGIIFGAVLGLILGTIQLRRFMRNYRILSE